MTVEEALTRLGSGDSALRARLLGALAVEPTFASDRDRRSALIREAVAVARRVGDGAALARDLASCHWCARDPESFDEALAWAGELVSIGEELADPEAALSGHLSRHDDLLERGDLVGATARLEAAEELARRLRQPVLAWRAAVRRTGDALRAGRLDEAEGLALAARQLSRDSAVDGSFVDGIFGAHLFLLRFEQGRLGEVEETITDLIASQPRLALWRAWLAFLYCETGRPAHARPPPEALVSAGLPDIPRDLARTVLLGAGGPGARPPRHLHGPRR